MTERTENSDNEMERTTAQVEWKGCSEDDKKRQQTRKGHVYGTGTDGHVGASVCRERQTQVRISETLVPG